jgi:glycosyltransferase involved in cell wall biosynthesis
VISVTAFAGKRWFNMSNSRLKAHILYLLETACLKLPYDRIVPLGSNFLEEIKELDVDPKSIVYLTPTTVDLQSFNPNIDGLQVRKKYGIAEDELVVLFVSTIDRTKGVFHLLDAFKEFHDIHPKSKLVFVGPGRDIDNLKKAIVQLNLDNSVVITGRIDHSEMPEVMACADVYVRPGFTEGMPMAVIEALACGKAVIAADVGGTSEIIIHGKTGLLINPKDLNATVRFLVDLSKDEGFRYNLGKNGRALIESKYTLEKMTQDYLTLYNGLA